MTHALDLPGGPSCAPGIPCGCGHRTFTLIEKPLEGYFRDIELGEAGPTGNIWLAERPLRDPHANHAVVGTLRLRGEIIRVIPGNPPDLLVFADADHLLSDGKITVLGSFYLPSDAGAGFDIAIVGGTGAYKGARGTVAVQAIAADTTQLTYNVLRCCRDHGRC